MANSEILAAIKSLQSSIESHLLITNQMVKEFMYSFDSRFASLQHNKPPPGFPSPSSSSHPPPTELSPFTKPNCDASGDGAIIPSPFSTRPKSPMEALALAKAYEARLEESRIEPRSGVREPIKAIPFISVQPSSPPNPFTNHSLTSNHSIHQQLGLFIHGYTDQSMEFNRDGLISATATQGLSTLHPLPQKTNALFKPPAEPPPHRSIDYRIHLLLKTGLINVKHIDVVGDETIVGEISSLQTLSTIEGLSVIWGIHWLQELGHVTFHHLRVLASRHEVVYQPQTDAHHLKAYTHLKPRTWDAYWSWVDSSYKNSSRSSIRMTPFHTLYGRRPPNLPLYIQRPANNQAVAEVQLHEEDQALHRLQPFKQISVFGQATPKLAQRFYRPCIVIIQVGLVAARLELLSTSWMHSGLHNSTLKFVKCAVGAKSCTLPPESHNSNTRVVMLSICSTRDVLSTERVTASPTIHLEDKVNFDGGESVMIYAI